MQEEEEFLTQGASRHGNFLSQQVLSLGATYGTSTDLITCMFVPPPARGPHETALLLEQMIVTLPPRYLYLWANKNHASIRRHTDADLHKTLGADPGPRETVDRAVMLRLLSCEQKTPKIIDFGRWPLSSCPV